MNLPLECYIYFVFPMYYDDLLHKPHIIKKNILAYRYGFFNLNLPQLYSPRGLF